MSFARALLSIFSDYLRYIRCSPLQRTVRNEGFHRSNCIAIPPEGCIHSGYTVKLTPRDAVRCSQQLQRGSVVGQSAREISEMFVSGAPIISIERIGWMRVD